MLSSCDRNDKKLETMTTKEYDEYVAIVWGDNTYIPFCAVDNRDQGVQIGIVNGDKKDQVYSYKDYSTDVWIISFYQSGEMDSSMLMKELNVTEIPNNLKSDYEWNINESKLDFSDLVSDFYDITPIDMSYSLYDSSKIGHIQPVLAVTESVITDISSDYLFLTPLYYSIKTDDHINTTNLKSLGILDVSYVNETDIIQQSFIRITTQDGTIYYKKIDSKNDLIYEGYYIGLEQDILNDLGNEDWYRSNPIK
jgi:hypothetical protein